MEDIESFKPKFAKITKVEKEALVKRGYSYCEKCNSVKLVSEFGSDKSNRYGFEATCKECRRLLAEQRRLDHPERTKQLRNECRSRSIDKYRNDKRVWDSENRDKINEYKKDKYRDDPSYKMQIACRTMVKRMFKSTQIKKCYKTAEVLGFTPKQLKEHLEKQFKPGMTWDNYGEWHIDHIVPISSAKSLADGLYLSRLDNLQPLWADENLTKGNRILTDLDNES